jgi:hypothetical protein
MDMTEAIRKTAEGRSEGHLAVKLTGLISIDVMAKLSTA